MRVRLGSSQGWFRFSVRFRVEERVKTCIGHRTVCSSRQYNHSNMRD